MSYNIPTPKGWQLVKLSDLGEVNRGKSKHRPRDADFLYGGKYPFIQTGDVKASGGRINSFNQTYSDEGLKQSRLWPEETMCITIAANIAETGVLQFPACFPDSVIGFIADKTKCDVYFIEYMFRLLKAKIKSQANGSVQDNINLQTLERILFPIPNLADQKKIAKILGVFDDKIIINNRLIETLEQMAQALFKSWFVDFEPVKAKMAALEEGGSQEDATLAAMTAISGKNADALAVFEREHPEQYAELKVTAELFPSAMQDSELGAIPEGWRSGTVIDVTDKVFSGGTPTTSKSEYWNGEFKWFSSGETRNSVITNTEKTITKLGVEQSSTKESVLGDVLIASAGQGHTRGQTSLNMINTYINQSVVAVRPKNKIFTCWLYMNLRSRYEEMRAISDSHSSRGSLTTKLVSGMPVIIPSENILQKFEKSIFPLFNSVKHRQREIDSLTQLRDTLLPKLLSGEITLPEAEQAISEAENV
ncbi:restriction endonuclease subunit S [Enterobacteriaceae bacterium]